MLTGGDAEISTLGFNLEQINKLAEFDYCYYQKGIRIGRHLLSSIYWKVIKEFRPDIILAHELGINTLFAILLRPLFNYEIYITIDDSPSMALHYGFKRELLRKWIFRHIHGALVVNPQVKNYLENKYKSSDCEYLYFPIIQNDVVLENKINSAQEKADEYTKLYKLDAKKIILFVGRLETIKAPDRLIETYESLNDKSSILVIVGKGSLLPHLKQHVKEKGLENKVILTGALSGKELYAWYYLAHRFVLPSTFEPFGAVVNEALVAGCYTIVSIKSDGFGIEHCANGSLTACRYGMFGPIHLNTSARSGYIRNDQRFVTGIGKLVSNCSGIAPKDVPQVLLLAVECNFRLGVCRKRHTKHYAE